MISNLPLTMCWRIPVVSPPEPSGNKAHPDRILAAWLLQQNGFFEARDLVHVLVLSTSPRLNCPWHSFTEVSSWASNGGMGLGKKYFHYVSDRSASLDLRLLGQLHRSFNLALKTVELAWQVSITTIPKRTCD